MDISSTLLATTIFVFLFLPGFIMLRAFWGDDRGALSSSNFYTYLMWGTLCSTLLYIVSFFLFNKIALSLSWFTNNHIAYSGLSLEYIFNLLLKKNVTGVDGNTAPLLGQIYKLISLSFLTDAITFALGHTLQWLILYLELDIKYDFFKFKNDWFYILTGRLHKNRPSLKNGFYVQIDCLCEVAGSMVIYKGFVRDYKLSNEALEYIYLAYVLRTALSESEVRQYPPKTIAQAAPTTSPTASISASSLTSTGLIRTNGAIEVTGDIKATGIIDAGGPIKCGGHFDASDAVIVETGQQAFISSPPVTPSATNTAPVWHRLPGSLMVLKASEIKNIHVNYIGI